MMKELINLSNTDYDLQVLLKGQPNVLKDLLSRHNLDGVEMMFAAPWDGIFPGRQYIQGVHLRFWPSWLDFWQHNSYNLQRIFPNRDALISEFGTDDCRQWLELFRKNLRVAAASGAPYFVFHVTNMRPWELHSRQFASSDREVIKAAADYINAVTEDISEDRLLLFENLWWSGLTLQNDEAAAYLLQQVHHKHSGFMFDTGHFLCSRPQIRTEQESIDYILHALQSLKKTRKKIYGVHLHCALSGQYALQCMQKKPLKTLRESLSYTLDIDSHEPFTNQAVQKIIRTLEPQFLVHEFIPSDIQELDHKIHIQRQALGWE